MTGVPVALAKDGSGPDSGITMIPFAATRCRCSVPTARGLAKRYAEPSVIILGLQDEIRHNAESRYDHRLHGVMWVASLSSCDAFNHCTSPVCPGALFEVPSGMGQALIKV